MSDNCEYLKTESRKLALTYYSILATYLTDKEIESEIDYFKILEGSVLDFVIIFYKKILESVETKEEIESLKLQLERSFYIIIKSIFDKME